MFVAILDDSRQTLVTRGDPGPDRQKIGAGMGGDRFGFDVALDGSIGTVIAWGEIDLATAPAFRRALAIFDAGLTLVLDLTGVTFIDSTGLHAMLDRAEAMAAAGGSIHIAGASPQVERLLDVAGVDHELAHRTF